jgi:hypothetical protein
MSKGSAAKERVYDQALSLILSLPHEYWVRMKSDLDKASVKAYLDSQRNIDEISLTENTKG